MVAPGKGAGFHTVLRLGSAVLAGLIAIMAYYLDDSECIEMVIEDIGKNKWNWILQECRNSGVPSCVVAAIVVVEVNERPSWMRVLERVCGYNCLQCVVVSYGITQERSKLVLADEESVRVTIR